MKTVFTAAVLAAILFGALPFASPAGSVPAAGDPGDPSPVSLAASGGEGDPQSPIQLAGGDEGPQPTTQLASDDDDPQPVTAYAAAGGDARA